MSDTAELQTRVSREAWQRYRAAEAARAGTSVEKGLADVAEAYKAKHPQAQHVPTPATDGPLTRQAKKLAIAIGKAKAGDIAEANGGSGRVFGNHKLPTYVVGGRS
jgi:hypothetical protein